MGGGGPVPKNGRKSRKMKSIVPDLSEKIMACMIYVQQNLNEFDHWSNWTGTAGVIWS